MRKIFSVLGAMLMLSTGCYQATVLGAPSVALNIFPRVNEVIINNCRPGSTIYVKTATGGEVPIKYGAAPTIVVRQIGNSDQVLLVARGVGPEGEYLGSQTRSVYFTWNGTTRSEPWEITYLSGGVGCR